MNLRPTPHQYQRYVLAAGWSLALIVLTGAAVRLTDAGLGCEDWPTCEQGNVAPAFELHGWIEFGNRLFSGVVAIAVCLAVLTAYRRIPARLDLIRWAWGLVAGVIAQILLGGVTVRVGLHPASVAAHYLLSMVLLFNVVVLWFKASGGGPGATLTVSTTVQNGGRALLALATAVAITGTVVTGTGPNGGDDRAERFPFLIRSVVQIHSVTVWVFLALTIAMVALIRRSPDASPRLQRFATVLTITVVAQGAIGYTQYFTGVPALLVVLHIPGSASVWIVTVAIYLAMFARPELETPQQTT